MIERWEALTRVGLEPAPRPIRAADDSGPAQETRHRLGALETLAGAPVPYLATESAKVSQESLLGLPPGPVADPLHPERVESHWGSAAVRRKGVRAQGLELVTPQ